MAIYDFSDIERELRLQGLLITYLQEEQKKRREELDQLERDWLKLKTNPKYQELFEVLESIHEFQRVGSSVIRKKTSNHRSPRSQ